MNELDDIFVLHMYENIIKKASLKNDRNSTDKVHSRTWNQI